MLCLSVTQGECEPCCPVFCAALLTQSAQCWLTMRALICNPHLHRLLDHAANHTPLHLALRHPQNLTHKSTPNLGYYGKQGKRVCLIVQVWEQEFAWTEVDKPVMVAARALTVPDDHKLNEQPIFCFETMMHMLYWSSIVYDYKRVRCCPEAKHWNRQQGNDSLGCAVCAVLCCAVLCCAVPCRAVLCCAVLCCAVPCCAVLCCTCD